MNAHMIKAICHQVARDLGGHKVAAALAEVTPGAWSGYCDFDRLEMTIPLHRAMLIEEKTGRSDFSRAMADRLGEAAAPAVDPRLSAARALQAIADAEVHMATAFADGTLTENEKRELLGVAQRVVAHGTKFAEAVARLETGAIGRPPTLKAI